MYHIAKSISGSLVASKMLHSENLQFQYCETMKQPVEHIGCENEYAVLFDKHRFICNFKKRSTFFSASLIERLYSKKSKKKITAYENKIRSFETIHNQGKSKGWRKLNEKSLSKLNIMEFRRSKISLPHFWAFDLLL